MDEIMQCEETERPQKQKKTRFIGNKRDKLNFCAQINCKCKKDCAKKIDVVKQQDAFEKFSKMKKWSQQTRFLRSLISSKPVAEKLNPIIDKKKRENVHIYHLFNESGSLTSVCLSFFTKVLQISRSKVFRSIKSLKTNPKAIERRGSANRKSSATDMKYVREFIGKFVAYPSRYNAHKTNLRYLHPRLTIRRMYQLYSESCAFKNRKILSESIFRRVLSTFELSLNKPQHPKCEICDTKGKLIFNEKAIEEQNINKNMHVEMVRKVRLDLASIVEMSQLPTEKIEVFSFELQEVIDLPHLSDSDVFFKKQIWLNTLTIYDEVRNIVHNYVWDETMASRESEDIASCLYKHLIRVPKDTQKIVLFSNPRFGQTQSMKIALMLQKFFEYCKRPELMTIEQHFFVPEHSNNSCTRAFKIIQPKLKLDKLFVPEDLVSALNGANKKESTFTATLMSTKDFFSCKPMLDHVKSTDGQIINWNNFQKIVYKRQNPFTWEVLEFNTSTFKTISLQMKCTPEVLAATLLIYSACGIRKISKSKYNDLLQLLKHVPEKYHQFYQSLSYDDDNASKDFALAE